MSGEADIQRSIMQAAEAADALVFRMNAGRGRYNQRLTPAGTPDLIIVPHHRPLLWVEVKGKTGELRFAQIAMHQELEERGQFVLTARGAEDVMEVLR